MHFHKIKSSVWWWHDKTCCFLDDATKLSPFSVQLSCLMVTLSNFFSEATATLTSTLLVVARWLWMYLFKNFYRSKTRHLFYFTGFTHFLRKTSFKVWVLDIRNIANCCGSFGTWVFLGKKVCEKEDSTVSLSDSWEKSLWGIKRHVRGDHGFLEWMLHHQHKKWDICFVSLFFFQVIKYTSLDASEQVWWSRKWVQGRQENRVKRVNQFWWRYYAECWYGIFYGWHSQMWGKIEETKV